jgi:GAF domain-containing protein/anti-sigma regulatory factor (Ser/Thr protein kinase)
VTSAASCTRLLSDVSGRLGQAGDPGLVADTVLPAVVKAFGAQVGSLALYRAPSTLRLMGTVGLESRPEVQRIWEVFDVSAGVPMAEAARTGEAVWVPDIEHVRERYPAWPRDAVSRSACAVPMCSGGRLVGVLGLAWRRPRAFSDVEKDALTAVGSIAAAACALDRQAGGRRLGVVDADTDRDDVHLAHLVRSRMTAVPRTVGTIAAVGAPTLSWLLEAPDDPALGVACEGVLALARRQESPPGVAARHVADLCAEMGGEASGVVLQVGPGAGWIAVAAVNACLVFSAPVMAGPGVTAFAGAQDAADEHVVVPDGEGASVLALLLSPEGEAGALAELVDVAHAEFDRRRGATAEDVLERVGERLGEHGLDGLLLGALAIVVAPRPQLPVLRRRLPARHLAVPLARRFALAALGPDPDPDVVFRLALTVDELVSNGTRHSAEVLELTVRPTSSGVRIEVSDDDDRTPLPQASPPVLRPGLSESGRGLMLIDAVADEWGVVPRDRGGKTVWAHVRL